MAQQKVRVQYDVEGPVAWITLNRPDKHNAQDLQMLEELDNAVERAQQDSSIRVTVLKGAGPSFSSGHDLHENVSDARVSRIRETAEGRTDLEYRMYVEVSMHLRNLRMPTIACVHGHCIGAGLMLAAMCDLVVASDDSSFSNPALLLGAAGTEILVEPWEIGARRAKELLFTGSTITAQRAMDWGLVNRVVPRDALLVETRELAVAVASMPPRAVELTKLSINRSLDAMGQATSWSEHFFIHQLSHSTSESERITRHRKEAGNIRGLKVRRTGDSNA